MFSLTGSFWGGPLKNWQGDQSTSCKSLFVPTLFLHPVNTMHCRRGGGGQLSRCQKPQIPLSWISAEPKFSAYHHLPGEKIKHVEIGLDFGGDPPRVHRLIHPHSLRCNSVAWTLHQKWVLVRSRNGGAAMVVEIWWSGHEAAKRAKKSEAMLQMSTYHWRHCHWPANRYFSQTYLVPAFHRAGSISEL